MLKTPLSGTIAAAARDRHFSSRRPSPGLAPSSATTTYSCSTSATISLSHSHHIALHHDFSSVRHISIRPSISHANRFCVPSISISTDTRLVSFDPSPCLSPTSRRCVRLWKSCGITGCHDTHTTERRLYRRTIHSGRLRVRNNGKVATSNTS